MHPASAVLGYLPISQTDCDFVFVILQVLDDFELLINMYVVQFMRMRLFWLNFFQQKNIMSVFFWQLFVPENVWQAPHPLYKPSTDLLSARDPLCAAVQPEYYKCDSPEQCDYEVEYADGGSSLGVLLRDEMHFNLTNGLTQSPRLAIGLVLLSVCPNTFCSSILRQ